MYCFQLFKTLRGKTRPLPITLEPAETNDLHMTGIVGDECLIIYS